MMGILLRARKASLVSCRSCHLVCRLASTAASASAACPRCGTALHFRIPNSIGRTWALVLAAVIFYVPAMVLPISTTATFAGTQGDTIMAALIKLGGLASFDIGPAAAFFAAVVVITMFAAMGFDPRLISDGMEKNHDPK